MAAAAALAANKQGKFWEFHHKLFENHNHLNQSKIQEIAQAMHLDMNQFNRDMKDPGIQMLIHRDLKDGREADVRGTPTVFINGRILRRMNLQGFQQIIAAELRKKS